MAFIKDRLYVEELNDFDKNNLTIVTDEGDIKCFDEIEVSGKKYYRIPRYFKFVKDVEDLSTIGEDIDINLNPNFKPLNEQQENAINAIVDNIHGLVSARVGFGKTYVAVNAITKIKKRTLIVVHVSTEDGLMDQWKNSLLRYTDIKEDDIGYLTSKTKVIDKPIYLTTVQTLLSRVKRDDKDFFDMMYNGNFGVTFYDECHITASSAEFSESTKTVFSRRMYGLSATLIRRDSLAPILIWNMGKTIYDDGQWFVLPIYAGLLDIPIKMGGYARYLEYGNASSWSAKYAKFLSKKEEYLRSLAVIVDKCLEQGRNPLVLSSQISLLYTIAQFSKYPEDISIVHGTVKNKDYDKRCILATLGMFKVGMDVPRLDTLIFATPLTAKNGLIQAIGRVARLYAPVPNKKVMLIDIVNPIYQKTVDMRNIRKKYYQEINEHSTEGCTQVKLNCIDDIDKLIRFCNK